MAKLDYKSMAEDLKERYEALSEYDQQAVEAIVEDWGYDIENALEVVESGQFVFYGGCPDML